MARLRLDFVSPLPPVRSGIADYAIDLLPELEARCDLRVIRLPGLPVAPEVERRWHPVPLAALGEAAGQGRLPLYQMGNNRYHEEVMAAAMRLPGVMTLHDLVLHHELLDLTLGRGDYHGYREQLTLDHGWVGTAVAEAKRWNAYGDAPVFALPANRSLLRRQRGVLVHSVWAAGMVQEEDPEVRVHAIPMGIPLPPLAPPPPVTESGDSAPGLLLRQRFGLPRAAPVVGSFGFQTPIKRTAAVVRALAAPGLEEVHLLIVGEAPPALDLEGEARRAGVASRVHVTGFLPFGDFSDAIAACDLCVNLRYPTAGETSASLLRVLAAGRPVVVSDYAQFAELPPTIARKVPLGDEEDAALSAVLRELVPAGGGSCPPAARWQRLRAMGEAAREHVRARHHPASAAAAVAEACREWAEMPPPGDAPARAAAPSSLAWGRLSGSITVEGAELPWAEGERRSLRVRLRNTSQARWLAGRRGPGGVALVVKLLAGGADLMADRAWLPLPDDLAPGSEAAFDFAVRRPAGPPSPPRPPGAPRLPVPPGTIRLWIEPHLFGGLALSEMGGPRWERDL